MEQFIKQKRKEIDAILLTIKPRLDSGELTLSYRSLQLAQMWCGKILGELGAEYPYRNGNDSKTKEIDARADQAAQPIVLTPGRVFAIKELRDYIKLIQSQINIEFTTEGSKPNTRISPESGRLAEKVVDYLQEALMWLGQELNNIKLRQEIKANLEEQYQDVLNTEGKNAYNKYGQSAGFKNSQGAPMPDWKDLNMAIQSNWIAVIKQHVRTPESMMGMSDRPDLWESPPKQNDPNVN